MIYTKEEIEVIVSNIIGTHIKRNNIRKKLKDESNAEVNKKIEALRVQIRKQKAQGFKECELRKFYANITKLELKIL